MGLRDRYYYRDNFDLKKQEYVKNTSHNSDLKYLPKHNYNLKFYVFCFVLGLFLYEFYKYL